MFAADFDTFGLTFSADKGLGIVSLYSETKLSAEDCRKSFLTLLPAVEAQYGSFAPMGFGLPPGAIISIHDIANANSEYRLADIPPSAAFAGSSFRMEAFRTFGARYIYVNVSHNDLRGNQYCLPPV